MLFFYGKLSFLKISVFLVLVLLLNAGAHAKSLDITEFVEETGVNDYAFSFAQKLTLNYYAALDNISKEHGGVADSQYDKVSSVFSEIFDSEYYSNLLFSYFLGGLSDDEQAEVFAFYNSPLGKSVAASELKMLSQRGQDYVTSIKDAINSEASRKEGYTWLIDAVDRDTHYSDIAELFSVSIAKAIASTISEVSQAKGVSDKATMLKKFEADLPQIKKKARSLALTSLYFMFGDFTDYDISKYIEFAESPAGAAFFNKRYEVLSQLVNQSTDDFIRSISGK